MINNLILLFALASLIVSCNGNTKKFDFKTLKEEEINLNEFSEITDNHWRTVPENVKISSITNSYEIRNQLLAFGDSLLQEYGKSHDMEQITSEHRTALLQFVRELIDNKHRGRTVEIDVEGNTLVYEHLKTEYSALEFEFDIQQPKPEYRYNATIKYHFKLSLNKDDSEAEGMKHLVFTSGSNTLYSAQKID